MQTKKYFFIILLFMLLTCFGMQTRMPAFAGTDDNVSGWAWNSNVGWISFNSTGCDADCNGSPCTHDGTCPLSGDYKDYGVGIDPSTGEFSGYAWNNNVGWISFNRLDTGNPPAPPYNLGTGPIAEVIIAEGVEHYKVKGWAKILSMGDDGWIRFDFNNEITNPTGEDYEAKIADGQLTGWAWNGNVDKTGIGWISLNCNSLGAGGCSAETYVTKVDLNAPPIISDMSAPNWDYDHVCTYNTALVANLKWTYNDAENNPMSAYKIIVKNESAGGTVVLNTGQCIGLNQCFAGDPSCTEDNCKIDLAIGYDNNTTPSYKLDDTILDYDRNYSWTVQVWDAYGASSEYTYDTNSDTDTDKNIDNKIETFTTYLSEFPDPDNFTWTPSNFSIDEVVLLSSEGNAKYYTGGVENDCDTNHCTWEWSDNSGLGNINFTDDTASSTDATFNSADSELRLTVTDTTDGKNYSCASTTKFNANKKLPTWIEAR